MTFWRITFFFTVSFYWVRAESRRAVPPGNKIAMRALGVYCGGGGPTDSISENCEETTPFMWHGALAVVEHHHPFRVRWQTPEKCDLWQQQPHLRSDPRHGLDAVRVRDCGRRRAVGVRYQRRRGSATCA